MLYAEEGAGSVPPPSEFRFSVGGAILAQVRTPLCCLHDTYEYSYQV